MFKKLKKMRIRKRLIYSYRLLSGISTLTILLVGAVMMILAHNYRYALKNYGFSQGNIGKAMTAFSDSRSAARAVIAYSDPNRIIESIHIHDNRKQKFEKYMKEVKKTIVSKEERKLFDEAQIYITKYWELDEQIVEKGKSDDALERREAQADASRNLDPVYEKVYTRLSKLMERNISISYIMEQRLNMMKNICIILVVLFSIMSYIMCDKLGKYMSNEICEPMGALIKRLKTFAQGNLKEPFPQLEQDDEIADMIREAQEMAENLGLVIGDIGYVLGEMSNGNYAVESKNWDKYLGEFISIRSGMEQLKLQMNGTLHQLEKSSEQVSQGADSMAGVGQSLAQGTTEQAASIEELRATIETITKNAQQTTESMNSACKEADRHAEEADAGRFQMNEMVEAMNRISDTSMKIVHIIEQMEEIASETNLLSLNASIEAARAGEAGKGFAVVAGEIGGLASQSAGAAANTRKLIENCVKEVKNGNLAAKKASDSMELIIEGMKKIVLVSENMKEAAGAQFISMKKIDGSVAQIADVIQENSSTAEESSAISEELAAQAENLNALVKKFKLS